MQLYYNTVYYIVSYNILLYYFILLYIWTYCIMPEQQTSSPWGDDSKIPMIATLLQAASGRRGIGEAQSPEAQTLP